MTTREPWSAPRALVAGTLAVALLDGLDAVVFFGLRGVSPIRIGQAIAAGLLGRAAYAGGVPAALLGAALHVLIAACVVAVYFAASRVLPVLARQPLVWGRSTGWRCGR